MSKYLTKEDIQDLKRVLSKDQYKEGFLAEIYAGECGRDLTTLTHNQILQEVQNCGIKIPEGLKFVRNDASVELHGYEVKY